MIGVDLKIGDRNDQAVHAPFTYVLSENVLHNLRYALIWDSLRPETEEPSNQENVKIEWLSFSKVRSLARNYSFLVRLQEEQKMVELTDKNQSILQEGSQLVLISKDYVKLRLALENKESIPASKINLHHEDQKEVNPDQPPSRPVIKEEVLESSSSSESDSEHVQPAEDLEMFDQDSYLKAMQGDQNAIELHGDESERIPKSPIKELPPEESEKEIEVASERNSKRSEAKQKLTEDQIEAYIQEPLTTKKAKSAARPPLKRPSPKHP